jgi:hypothetical protein
MVKKIPMGCQSNHQSRYPNSQRTTSPHQSPHLKDQTPPHGKRSLPEIRKVRIGTPQMRYSTVHNLVFESFDHRSNPLLTGAFLRFSSSKSRNNFHPELAATLRKLRIIKQVHQLSDHFGSLCLATDLADFRNHASELGNSSFVLGIE